LARRRIEQHAYIPYTHGSRRICGGLLTEAKTCAWRLSAAMLMRPAAFEQ